MHLSRGLALLCLMLCWTSMVYGTTVKKRIFIVSSYHKDYLWSQETQQGVSAAMLQYGYLDNTQQVEALVKNDYVESTKAVIQKDWMNTKRKHSPSEIAAATQRIVPAINSNSRSVLKILFTTGHFSNPL